MCSAQTHEVAHKALAIISWNTLDKRKLIATLRKLLGIP